MASFLPIYVVEAQEVHYEIYVSVDNSYYLRGETVVINVFGNASMSYTLTVYNPLNNIVYSKSRQTDLNGKDTLSLSISPNFLSGTYTVKATVGDTVSATLVSIVETTSYKPQIFPFERQHKGVNYTITARGFRAVSKSGNITIKYPSLPISFSVNAYANNMTFVERLKNTQLGIYIDLSYLFIHKGMKLVINGSIPQPTTYSFNFESPRQLLKKLDALKNGFLVFDWSDMRKVAQAFSYNHETHRLTVNIPQTFRIDPYVFEAGFETNDLSEFTGNTTETGAYVGVQSSVVKAGSYAGNLTCVTNGADAGIYKELASEYTTVYFGSWFRTTEYPRPDAVFNLAFYLGEKDTYWAYRTKVWYENTTGSVTWSLYTKSDDASAYTNDSSCVVEIDTWYWVEVKQVADSSVGEVRLYIDDVEVASITGLDNNSAGKVDKVELHVYSYKASPNLQHYFDTVIVDTSSIGMPSSNTAPTIGEFDAPTTVYANQYVFLNATVEDDDGISEIVNATIEISNDVILKWDNATATFSESSDTNGYCTLDATNSVESEKNATAFDLSWKIKLNNYPSGSVNVTVTNTKVWDSTESGSGSTSGVFTFAYITLTLQARDKDETNLPRAVTIAGTMGNSTAYSVTSSTSGSYALTTCYGTHTATVTWQSHTVKASTSFSVTADKTQNLDTLISRLSSGSSYVLISLDSTTLATPTLKPNNAWRIESIQGSAQKQLKVDNANWLESGEPWSLTTGGNTYEMRSDGWTYASNIFTYNYVDFAGVGEFLDLQMEWAQPSTSSDSTSTVEPEPIIVPVTPVTPQPPIHLLMFVGVVAVVGVLGFALYQSQTRKNMWSNTDKKTKVKWPKSKKQKKPKWKNKK